MHWNWATLPASPQQSNQNKQDTTCRGTNLVPLFCLLAQCLWAVGSTQNHFLMRKQKDQPQEINAGSMADIAFLLLVFFLVTTTMAKEVGLQRKLPQPIEDSAPVPQRNILEILVNRNNDVLVNGTLTSPDQVKEKTLEFLNSSGANTGPIALNIDAAQCQKKIAAGSGVIWENKLAATKLLGPYAESKAVVSLQTDRTTSYKTYIKVQDQLAQAYFTLRNNLAQERLGKEFEACSAAEKKAIKTAIPQRISEAEPIQTP